MFARAIRFCLLVCLSAAFLVSCFERPLSAQSSTSSTQPATPEASSQTTVAQTAVAPAGRITEYSLPPELERKAVAHYNAYIVHVLVNTLFGLVVLLLVLRLKVAAKYRDWAEGVSKWSFVQALIFVPLYLLTVDLIGLPSDMWDQSLSRKFGLSVQAWGSWFGDWMTGQVISLIVGTLLIWILFFVVRRSPRRWWFYFWLAAIPVRLALFFIQPVVIDPLFYTFKPLETGNPALVIEIERVMHHGGMDISRDRMYEMNASSKNTETNAYVTGFGASKRVVVWDNTIKNMTTPETLFVFGHEMGHYVLLHIPKEISIFALILLALLYLGYRVTGCMLGRWGQMWGIRGVDDWASLPALILLFSVIIFFATPVFSSISRHFEHEADRYGLEVIHGIVPDPGQVAAHSFQKLGETNLANPHPNWFLTIWYSDHPATADRVRFVAGYDPWGRGEAPVYVK